MDDGGAELAVQLHQLEAHIGAEPGIEIGERLVEQEGGGLAHQGPAEGHPLALPARQRRRLAAEEGGDAQHGGHFAHPLLDLGLGELVHLEAEGEVLADGHMGVEGIALEDDGDVAVPRRQLIDPLTADPDLAAADALEPGDHAQGRRFAAARGPQQDHEFAVANLEGGIGHGGGAGAVELRYLPQLDRGHASPRSAAAYRCRCSKSHKSEQ